MKDKPEGWVDKRLSGESQRAAHKRITLTPKQVDFISARIEGKTRVESLKQAGYAPSTTYNRIEDNPNVRGLLLASMRARGIDEAFITDKLKAGLSAQKSIYATKDGLISDIKKVPDNETQHKYFKDTLEIRGDIKQDVTNNLQIGLISVPDLKASESWDTIDNTKQQNMESEDKQSIE